MEEVLEGSARTRRGGGEGSPSGGEERSLGVYCQNNRTHLQSITAQSIRRTRGGARHNAIHGNGTDFEDFCPSETKMRAIAASVVVLLVAVDLA